MWRPIETAPRDGTQLLAFVPGAALGALNLAWWDGRWREPAQGLGVKIEPTHWMPLPEPPVHTQQETL